MRVEPVQLVDVDVVGAESAQAGLETVDQVLAREAVVRGGDTGAPASGVVEPVAADGQPQVGLGVAHSRADLRAEDDLIASAADRLAEDLLARTGAVDVSGVEGVDPPVQSGADKGGSGCLVQRLSEVR